MQYSDFILFILTQRRKVKNAKNVKSFQFSVIFCVPLWLKDIFISYESCKLYEATKNSF